MFSPKKVWLSQAAFGSISHHTHRQRRAPVAAYFSKGSVASIQDSIWDHANRLGQVLHHDYQQDHIVHARPTFLAWSNDTLRSHAFGECNNLLDDRRRASLFDRFLLAFAAFYPITKQCPWVIPLTLKMPVAPWRVIYPPLAALLTLHHVSQRTFSTYHEAVILTKMYT